VSDVTANSAKQTERRVAGVEWSLFFDFAVGFVLQYQQRKNVPHVTEPVNCTAFFVYLSIV